MGAKAVRDRYVDTGTVLLYVGLNGTWYVKRPITMIGLKLNNVNSSKN